MRERKSRRVVSCRAAPSRSSGSSGNGRLLLLEALHGDGPGGSSSGAEAAADADLLVLDQDRAGPDPGDEHRSELARARRRLADQTGREDLDAVLGTDVLASAAED